MPKNSDNHNLKRCVRQKKRKRKWTYSNPWLCKSGGRFRGRKSCNIFMTSEFRMSCQRYYFSCYMTFDVILWWKNLINFFFSVYINFHIFAIHQSPTQRQSATWWMLIHPIKSNILSCKPFTFPHLSSVLPLHSRI
jgi:hypothetical protein